MFPRLFDRLLAHLDGELQLLHPGEAKAALDASKSVRQSSGDGEKDKEVRGNKMLTASSLRGALG